MYKLKKKKLLFLECPVLSHFNCIQPFAKLWPVADQASQSMGFSRQENQNGLPCPLQGIFPTLGSNPHLYVSCIVRRVLYHQHHLGNPFRIPVIHSNFHGGSDGKASAHNAGNLMAESEDELKSLLMKVKSESEVTQSCPTLSDPMDSQDPPGSSVHGIFQARVLEWGAIAFSDCSLQHYL